MLFYPIDFGDLITDSLIDTGAISSAISEADLEKTQQLTPQNILKECHPPDFQSMVANRELETPIATREMQFEVGISLM